jgi:hypothetical protein
MDCPTAHATAVQSITVLVETPWTLVPTAPAMMPPTRPPYQVMPARAKRRSVNGAPVRRCTSIAK